MPGTTLLSDLIDQTTTSKTLTKIHALTLTRGERSGELLIVGERRTGDRDCCTGAGHGGGVDPPEALRGLTASDGTGASENGSPQRPRRLGHGRRGGRGGVRRRLGQGLWAAVVRLGQRLCVGRRLSGWRRGAVKGQQGGGGLVAMRIDVLRV